MDDEKPFWDPIRQPRSFWQWLTNQPGTLYAPPPAPIVKVNPGRTALNFIEAELERVHEQMDGVRGAVIKNPHERDCYNELTKTLSKLHDELIRRSKEEQDKC